MQFCAYRLQTGRMNETEVFERLFHQASALKNFRSLRVAPTVQEEEVITQAKFLLKDYFASMGVLYRPSNIFFLPNNLFGHKVGAVYYSVYDTIVLPSNLNKIYWPFILYMKVCTQILSALHLRGSGRFY